MGPSSVGGIGVGASVPGRVVEEGPAEPVEYPAAGSVAESAMYAAGAFSSSLVLLHRVIDRTRP